MERARVGFAGGKIRRGHRAAKASAYVLGSYHLLSSSQKQLVPFLELLAPLHDELQQKLSKRRSESSSESTLEDLVAVLLEEEAGIEQELQQASEQHPQHCPADTAPPPDDGADSAEAGGAGGNETGSGRCGVESGSGHSQQTLPNTTPHETGSGLSRLAIKGMFAKAVSEAVVACVTAHAWAHAGDFPALEDEEARMLALLETLVTPEAVAAMPSGRAIILVPNNTEAAALSFKEAHERVWYAAGNAGKAAEQQEASVLRGRVVCVCGMHVERRYMRKHEETARHKDIITVRQLAAKSVGGEAEGEGARKESKKESTLSTHTTATTATPEKSVASGGASSSAPLPVPVPLPLPLLLHADADPKALPQMAHQMRAFTALTDACIDADGLGQRFKCTDLSLSNSNGRAKASNDSNAPHASHASLASAAVTSHPSPEKNKTVQKQTTNATPTTNTSTLPFTNLPLFQRPRRCGSWDAEFQQVCADLETAKVVGRNLLGRWNVSCEKEGAKFVAFKVF
jgi:hypothetical protein